MFEAKKRQVSQAHAWLYVGLGLALIAFGFIISGPSIPDFWYWLTMPVLVVLFGMGRLWHASRQQPCEHQWVPVHRGRGHDIVLNIDRCARCRKERDWLVSPQEE